MKSALNKLSTVGMSREEWLECRRLGIGGSDAAAILGLNPYNSPYSVWADKVGLLPAKEDTEAMKQGRDLENYVAERFCEATGAKVRRQNEIIQNPEYRYSFANIDRRITGAGIRAGLECKTCSPFRIDEFKDGMYPQEYYIQSLHYLAVTGFDVWYIAVLVFGTEFKIFRIDRKDVQNDIVALMKAEYEFWTSYVIPGVAPPADGTDATTDAINKVYAAAVDGSVDLSGMERDFIEIAALTEQQKSIEVQKEQHKQNIKIAMGKNTRAECSAWVANWKPRRDGVRVFNIKEKLGG